MNHRTKVLFLSCAAALLCFNASVRRSAHADPYPEGKYPVADAFIKQDITPPKTSLPIDDYMIPLAKASNADFIADVTSIPKEEMIQPFPATIMAKYYHWKPDIGLVQLDLTQQSKMSILRYDSTTFLFWKEPDAVQLASQWVKETDTDPNERLPDAVDLYNIITKGKDLLKDFPKEGKVVDIPLADLSLEQRDKALAAIRQLFMSSEGPDRAWFSNDFWNTATLRLTPLSSGGKPVLTLAVMGTYHQVTTGTSIIGLQAPEQATVKPMSKN